MEGVRLVNPERTPLADLLPRVSTNREVVHLKRIDETGTVVSNLEGQTEYEYPQAETETSETDFDIIGYGYKEAVSDKLILSTENIYDAQSVVELSMVNAIRQYEEKQIARGTDENWGNDENGFEGLPDIGEEADVLDLNDKSTKDVLDKVRSIKDTAIENGATEGDLIVAVSFDVWEDLRDELSDKPLYEVQISEFSYGFNSLLVDGVKVMKSHGFNSYDDVDKDNNEPIAVAVDTSDTAMYTLRDVSLEPLAKREAAELMSVSCYATLATRAPSHIQYLAIEDSA
ncbi:MAG: hypothetical protein ACOCRX_11540 [Candidatus Woesearchaeota archaeon]